MRTVLTFELPKTHHALPTPEKWDNDWETLIQKNVMTPALCLSDLTNNWRHGIDGMYDSYSQLLSSTCEIQWRVGMRALHYFQELEPAWMASTREERRKHVLIGMSTVCSKARNLNDARGYCSDVVRLDKLSRDPATFLDVLRSLMLDDLSQTPTTPRYIPNEDWDSFSRKIDRTGTDMEKVCMRYLVILRTKLIYMVIEFSFLSFLGEPLPELTVMKHRGQTPLTDTAIPLAVQKKIRELQFGKEVAKQINKDDRIAQKDRASKRGVVCTGCSEKQQAGESFQQCQKCKQKMNRDVPYCSRQCQVDHWKHHKVVCGKSLDLEASIAAAVPKGSAKANGTVTTGPLNVGPPLNGFKRSFALMKHIQYLNSNPTVDLLLHTRPGPVTDALNTTRTDIPYPPVQIILRRVRDTAMRTGDKNAAAMMCHFSIWFFVAKDMEDQYDIDCVAEQAATEFEMSSLELKKKILDLHEQYLLDPYKRPPAMAAWQLHPTLWENFVNASPLDMEKKIVFKNMGDV